MSQSEQISLLGWWQHLPARCLFSSLVPYNMTEKDLTWPITWDLQITHNLYIRAIVFIQSSAQRLLESLSCRFSSLLVGLLENEVGESINEGLVILYPRS